MSISDGSSSVGNTTRRRPPTVSTRGALSRSAAGTRAVSSSAGSETWQSADTTGIESSCFSSIRAGIANVGDCGEPAHWIKGAAVADMRMIDADGHVLEQLQLPPEVQM